MRLAGEMKRERDEAREKEEILFELHEGRMREAERRKEALELELEIRAVLSLIIGQILTRICTHSLSHAKSGPTRFYLEIDEIPYRFVLAKYYLKL